jgi:hypothetical protein
MSLVEFLSRMWRVTPILAAGPLLCDRYWRALRNGNEDPWAMCASARAVGFTKTAAGIFAILRHSCRLECGHIVAVS